MIHHSAMLCDSDNNPVCPDSENNPMYPDNEDNPVFPNTENNSVGSKTKDNKQNPKYYDNTVIWIPEPSSNEAIWCRKSVNSTLVLWPEMTLYYEPGKSVISWHREFVNSISRWSGSKYTKYNPELNIMVKILGLILYIFDLATDVYSAYKHLSRGDYVWGQLTIAFTVAPMVLSSIFGTVSNISRSKYLWALATIPGTPFLPFGILVWSVVSSIRSYPDEDSGATGAAGLIKMCETLLESYPQAAIQLFFIFQTGDPIETWQWFTIATSITALSFAVTTTIATLDDDIDDATNSSKITWFVCGLLAVVSRLVVASVFSMAHSLLWFVPIGTEFATTIIAWSIIRFCPCSMCTQLHTGFHGCPVGTMSVPLTWLLTTAYNSFTLTGLAVSTVNLLFAISAWFLSGPQQAAVITAIILAVLSWIANVILAALPHCKAVRDDWMRIDDGTCSSLLY